MTAIGALSKNVSSRGTPSLNVDRVSFREGIDQCAENSSSSENSAESLSELGGLKCAEQSSL
jgi:hypothetical protein